MCRTLKKNSSHGGSRIEVEVEVLLLKFSGLWDNGKDRETGIIAQSYAMPKKKEQR